ncbi:MAG TPA: MBL fold metallo-hydrolase [Thermoanaerobaculia bacterium]|nr:MBL fold metallo-hydrolase [Thermoanaerobaculia bacterium]
MRAFTGSLALLLALSCATAPPSPGSPYAIVLGIAQDGGYPQAGCNRPDCIAAWNDPALRRRVASLAIVDPASGQRWIIDATPDFPSQLRTLDEAAPGRLSGILLTHAHVGHYAGLIHLGREVMGTRGVPAYAMPRMRAFLERNGPWDQLVRLGNIELRTLEAGRPVTLNERITVIPLPVPHRDEYSETVAFVVRGPSGAVLWLPDIDKWEKWTTPLESAIAEVDVAFLDATFYDESELPGRDLSEIPHPTVTETMQRLEALPAAERSKVRFIHLNQSNPALRPGAALEEIRRRGFDVAREGERSPL